MATAVGISLISITTLAATGGITTTGGDLYVGGDLFVKDDLVLDEITARDVTISGIATINKLDVVGLGRGNIQRITWPSMAPCFQ